MNKDIEIGPLTLDVLRYQFKENTKDEDADWVVITAVCEYTNAMVKIMQDACVYASDFAGFLEQCKEILKDKKGKAHLNPLEPYFDMSIEFFGKNNEELLLEVNITPNNVLGDHTFYHDMKISELEKLIKDLEKIVEKFPVR